MPLQPGDIIGNYRVLHLVGSGGMGHVYKVQNTLSHRIEAMKILLPELSANPELSGRFMREIQVQAALVHPNIATLHTALQIGGQMVMLMEYVDGETLELRLRRGAVPVDECVGIAAQVLSALAYAHKQGVVHRDVKPANIILGTSGVAKMMDFGLAAVGTPGGEDRRLTRTGTVMGSLSYMSPEQVRGQAPTARSDIYSFGLTLYEMLTGVRGVTGDSDYAVMTAHLDVMPPAPAALNSSIPTGLSDIVLRAIAKQPAGRFSSADEFAASLAEYRSRPQPAVIPRQPTPVHQHAAAADETGVPPVAVRVQPPHRSVPALWIGATAAIVAAVAAGIYWRSSSNPPEKSSPPGAIEVAEAPAAKTPPAVSNQTPPATPPSRPVAPPKAATPPAVNATTAPEPIVNAPVVRATAPAAAPATNAPEPAKSVAVAPTPVAVAAVPEPAATAPAAPVGLPSTQPAATTSGTALAPATAAPVAAPAASAPATPVAVSPGEIAAALDRLQTAYSSRDMSQVRAAFPGITADHAKQLERFFNSARSASLRLEPVGQPRQSADRVIVEARHWLTAKFKDGTEQRPAESRAILRLVKGRAGWVVDAMEFAQRGRSLFPPL
jgi:serine/threonine protein kinase